MNELIQLITSRTPLNPQQAEEVIHVAGDFLRSRLPAPLSEPIDALLASGGQAGAAGTGAGGILGAIGWPSNRNCTAAAIG